MLSPKKVKHRKWHLKSGMSGRKASRLTEVNFGSFGLKSLDESWITSRQIESARRVIVRYTRKNGKMWIRIFPDKPITFHGNEMKMGKGKGAPEYWVAVVKPGTVMFEVDGIPEEEARKALTLAGHKLPIKTKIIKK